MLQGVKYLWHYLKRESIPPSNSKLFTAMLHRFFTYLFDFLYSPFSSSLNNKNSLFWSRIILVNDITVRHFFLRMSPPCQYDRLMFQYFHRNQYRRLSPQQLLYHLFCIIVYILWYDVPTSFFRPASWSWTALWSKDLPQGWLTSRCNSGLSGCWLNWLPSNFWLFHVARGWSLCLSWCILLEGKVESCVASMTSAVKYWT